MSALRLDPIEMPTRSNQHWCNLCSAACASDDDLRAHYRQCHPEVAARLEALAQQAQGGGLDLPAQRPPQPAHRRPAAPPIPAGRTAHR
jgi:hypothetical protein